METKRFDELSLSLSSIFFLILRWNEAPWFLLTEVGIIVRVGVFSTDDMFLQVIADAAVNIY